MSRSKLWKQGPRNVRDASSLSIVTPQKHSGEFLSWSMMEISGCRGNEVKGGCAQLMLHMGGKLTCWYATTHKAPNFPYKRDRHSRESSA